MRGLKLREVREDVIPFFIVIFRRKYVEGW
jgi:hypothetical protein